MRALKELSRWWSTVFALDYRSLAAFRIGIGVMLLVDVIFRAQTLSAMYTDNGVMPRSLMRELWKDYDAVGLQQWGVGTWSLHALGGGAGWQIALFLAAGIFALMLVAGAYTRLATIASFILLVSVHNRIPLVLTSGDTHLRIVMFWAMFLPLGKLWSVDATRVKVTTWMPNSNTFVSAATAGLVVQVFILYFFSGLAKWNAAWWSGDAMIMAIKLTIYNTDWAQGLLHYPMLTRVLSIGTVAAEVFLPWLLFVSFQNSCWRALNLMVFVAMHLAIVCIMTLGLFSFICCIVWLALVPSGFWDWLGIKMNLSSSVTTVKSSRQLAVSAVAQVFCGFMIPFMLIWNVINLDQSCVATPVYDPVRTEIVRGYRETKSPLFHAFEISGHALGVGQHFQMFGFPPTEDTWFVYRATLRNGTVRDIFLGGRQVIDNQPLSGRSSIPNHHWRQIHRNLTDGGSQSVRQRLAAFAVEQWNKTHSPEEQVEQMRLECYSDTTWPDPIPGEAKGAIIWGTYPDGSMNPFDAMLNQSKLGGKSQGF